jgi:hypothetical protein
MLETIATAGEDDQRVAFVSTPGVRELLQQREVITGSGRFIWDNDCIVNRPAYATADQPSATMLAGVWSEVLVGLWGDGIRIEVNPFRDFRSGVASLRIMLSCDVQVLRADAFCKATAIS